MKIKNQVGAVNRTGKITPQWLYSWGWSCMAAAEACGVSRTHKSLCLKGRRRMSPELKQRVLSLPKREPVTGKYMAEMKGE